MMWRVLVRMENRIIANADKAHEAIGKNIERLDNRINGLDGDIKSLSRDVSDLREDVGWIKGKMEGER